jgi:pilus assembly protein CpaB
MLVLVVAVIVAVGSGVGVFSVLRDAKASARVPTGSVVVASADLLEGRILTKDDVRVVTIPIASVPRGAFAQLDSVVGRVTRVPVFTGEALVPGRLAPVGATAGLEVKITTGKRAMAVQIDEVAGLSGLIQPNSRVDVLVTVRDDGTTSQRAKLFMSNMRVLSVGQQLDRGKDGRAQTATTAALEVTPSEAEELAIAANQGKIQLVLRGYGDREVVTTNGASIGDMFRRIGDNGRAIESPRPAATAPRVVYLSAPRAAPTPTTTVVPALPNHADSVIVSVYRADKVTQQKVVAGDTIKRTP